MAFYEALKASILKVLGEIIGGILFFLSMGFLLIVYGGSI